MANNTINNEENFEIDSSDLIDEVVLEELKAYKGKGKDEELTPEEIDEILEDIDKAEVWMLDKTCNKENKNEKNERDKQSAKYFLYCNDTKRH